MLNKKIGLALAGTLLAAHFGVAAADNDRQSSANSNYQQGQAAQSDYAGPPPGFAEKPLPPTKSTYRDAHPVTKVQPRGPYDPA